MRTVRQAANPDQTKPVLLPRDIKNHCLHRRPQTCRRRPVAGDFGGQRHLATGLRPDSNRRAEDNEFHVQFVCIVIDILSTPFILAKPHNDIVIILILNIRAPS